MDIVVIGLGSMGKRRIRLIRELYPDYSIIGVDGRADRRKEAEEQFQIRTSESVSDIENREICAFVCTSPLSHASIITTCLCKGWNVFTELNLVATDYEKNILLAKEKGKVLFLSSTFFYREEIKKMQSYITGDRRWNYIYHIGQYLPDWHPWENYKDFFIGDQRTNGCREIMAIELPWLIRTFGEISDANVLSDRMTGLDICFDDNYIVQFSHKNGNKGVLVVDVVSPVAVRKFEAYAEGRYVSWNGTPDSVSVFDPDSKKLKAVSLDERAEHMDGYSAFIVENAYKNEIREFFAAVICGKKPEYGFEQDLQILKIIDSLGA